MSVGNLFRWLRAFPRRGFSPRPARVWGDRFLQHELLFLRMGLFFVVVFCVSPFLCSCFFSFAAHPTPCRVQVRPYSLNGLRRVFSTVDEIYGTGVHAS